MLKKPALLFAALAVIALAAPAVSSAAKLTMPANTLVPVGTEITGESTNTELETEFGTISCANVTFTDEVTANNGSNFEAEPVGEGTTAECFLGNEVLITVTHFTFRFWSSGPHAGELTWTWILDLPGGIECHYHGFIAWFYITGASSFHHEGELEGGVCGGGFIEGDFSLSTTGGGGAVILS